MKDEIDRTCTRENENLMEREYPEDLRTHRKIIKLL
jgi:hypothetical protein